MPGERREGLERKDSPPATCYWPQSLSVLLTRLVPHRPVPAAIQQRAVHAVWLRRAQLAAQGLSICLGWGGVGGVRVGLVCGSGGQGRADSLKRVCLGVRVGLGCGSGGQGRAHNAEPIDYSNQDVES